jgi:hypothetical protein
MILHPEAHMVLGVTSALAHGIDEWFFIFFKKAGPEE